MSQMKVMESSAKAIGSTTPTAAAISFPLEHVLDPSHFGICGNGELMDFRYRKLLQVESADRIYVPIHVFLSDSGVHDIVIDKGRGALSSENRYENNCPSIRSIKPQGEEDAFEQREEKASDFEVERDTMNGIQNIATVTGILYNSKRKNQKKHMAELFRARISTFTSTNMTMMDYRNRREYQLMGLSNKLGDYRGREAAFLNLKSVDEGSLTVPSAPNGASMKFFYQSIAVPLGPNQQTSMRIPFWSELLQFKSQMDKTQRDVYIYVNFRRLSYDPRTGE
ncbi:hypothetical protein EDD18DRAFT_1112939 [Armillaria luteobubalina]|uniref:Uncharacterized protein n=1 Tax=Armillaria luteobubalina TaxID=153913 RepID=A0AA39UJY1_9AGAR|nr:hypothetical protein EDD18DRAFT_1112939 [Armillaria luteobubalina]